MVVNTGQSPQQLAEYLSGPAITPFNATMECVSSAIGTFEVTGINTLGIDSGVVLSTGHLDFGQYATIVGPNDGVSDGPNAPINGPTSDPDLSTLVNGSLRDVCWIKFDFVPLGDSIKFDYIFASSEYWYFSCAQYNDVFGFFLSGPGIAGSQNLALIPGTNVPVTVNSTTGLGTCGQYPQYYNHNQNGPTTSFGGYTDVFTAQAAVQPCDTYSLKIAIADVNDSQLDSGVFLKGGSLSTIGINEEEDEICVGELPYTWHGYTWDANTPAGVYSHIATYSGQTTCDSVFFLELTINDGFSSDETIDICTAELPFTWHGELFDANTTPGTYNRTVSYPSSTDCDSVFHLELNITEEPEIDEIEQICAAQLPFTWRGHTWDATTPPGNYTEQIIVSNPSGCDSVFTLALIIDDDVVLDETESLCTSELPFTWRGQTWNANTSPGTYTHSDTVSTGGACDSIFNLTLVINPDFTSIESEQICQSALPFTWQGQTWGVNTNAGTYTHTVTIPGVGGCDTVLNLTLEVLPEYDLVENHAVCMSGLPFTWHGQTWDINTSAGVYNATATYQSSTGCDSIHQLTLTVNNIIEIEEEIEICQSSLPFTWHGQTWGTNSNPGNYTHEVHYLNAQNCDSIHYLNLNIQNEISIQIDTTVCKESFPFVWENQTITQGGLYTNVLTGVNNCDSTLKLNVFTYPNVSEETINLRACNVVDFEGEAYFESVSFSDTLQNVAGCDSLIRHINIQVTSDAMIENIALTGCNEVVFEGRTYYQSANFTDTISNTEGCDSLWRIVDIQIDNFNLQLTASADTIFEGELLKLTTNANTAYTVFKWTPEYIFPYQTVYEQTILLDESKTIWVFGRSVNDCIDSASVFVQWEPVDVNVFMPNAFSPNGDGLNDDFGPELSNTRGYVIEDFSVYNRYGQRLFFNAGEYNRKWDGTYKGKKMDLGTYFYYIRIRLLNGEMFESKGDFQLLR